MTSLRVAAVQASHVLMDQAATMGRVAELAAAARGAQLAAFQLHVDISARPAFIGHSLATEPGAFPAASPG